MGENGYKVVLSPRALRDLEEIVVYIASDDPQAAKRFGGQLIDEAESIGLHPLKGRVVPEFRDPPIREWIFRSYRIVYRVVDEQHIVIVSRFWHAARARLRFRAPFNSWPPVFLPTAKPLPISPPLS